MGEKPANNSEEKIYMGMTMKELEECGITMEEVEAAKKEDAKRKVQTETAKSAGPGPEDLRKSAKEEAEGRLELGFEPGVYQLSEAIFTQEGQEPQEIADGTMTVFYDGKMKLDGLLVGNRDLKMPCAGWDFVSYQNHELRMSHPNGGQLAVHAEWRQPPPF